jgi:hypothetical protein
MQTPSSILFGELIHNKNGERFTASKARFQVVAAGRRSGKTLRAKRKFAKRAILDMGHYAACAPTRDQAKALYWDDLKALLKPACAGIPSESDLTIRLRHGGEVAIVGLDKPQRIEGPKWNGFLVDEVDEMKPEAWPSTLRPALGETLGFAWLIGRPKGFRLLYELYKLGQGLDPEYAGFTWKSEEILSPEEIASAKRTMDPRLFRQEYEASFEAPGGTVYDDFSRELNAGFPCPFDKRLQVIIGMDFNVNPMTAVMVQAHGPELWVPWSIEQPNSHSSRLAGTLRATLAEFYGGDDYPEPELWVDPSGCARQQNIGTSDVDILRRAGFDVHYRPVYAESDKFNAVRAFILNAKGERRLRIDPGQTRLTERLEQLVPDDADDHLTDALGYAVFGKFYPDLEASWAA